MKRILVVIGSGLAGSLLCNELVQYFDVTLLEKGPKGSIKIPDIQCIKKDLAEISTFCFGQGGTTSLWHNGLIPINIKDVNSEDFRTVLAEASPYMDQAADALYFRNRSFLAEYERIVAELNALSDQYLGFPHGIDCLIYPKHFKKLQVDPKVSAVYGVQDIEFSFEDSRIKTVHYKSDGIRNSIDADYVLVSAGAMGTPGVLQKIFARTGVDDPRVGLGFIDHPKGFVGKVKFKKNFVPVLRKLSTYDKGEYLARNAVRLKSQCGNYTACAYFRPALTMANSLDIYKYKVALGAGSGMSRVKKMVSPKILHPDILAEIFSHLFNVSIPGRKFNILFVGEQKRGKSRVFFEGDRLQVDWSISDQELAVYQEMLRELEDMLEGLVDEMNIKTDITEDWLWSMAHHSGTVSMGDADEDLVDRDLKLRCCDNVYVCDGSVIQEHSYANTGLTIGMLALRLADRIREEAT